MLLVVAFPEANAAVERLSESRIRGFERVRNGVDLGWFPDPWRLVRMGWEPAARRLTLFEERSANKVTPSETGRIVVGALTYADEAGGEPFFHDELAWLDEVPDGNDHSSNAYIQLNPDGSVRTLRFYGSDHRIKLEIAKHREVNLDSSNKPVLHYHVYDYSKGVKAHGEARRATKAMRKRLGKLFEGSWK